MNKDNSILLIILLSCGYPLLGFGLFYFFIKFFNPDLFSKFLVAISGWIIICYLVIITNNKILK